MSPRLFENCREDLVVHPLFDVREEKLDPLKVGPMRMTSTVRLGLIALRVYLVSMVLLVAYRALQMGGAIK